VGFTADPDDVKERKFLTLPRLEQQYLCRPARTSAQFSWIINVNIKGFVSGT
jgi:hypothetical protein